MSGEDVPVEEGTPQPVETPVEEAPSAPEVNEDAVFVQALLDGGGPREAAEAVEAALNPEPAPEERPDEPELEEQPEAASEEAAEPEAPALSGEDETFIYQWLTRAGVDKRSIDGLVTADASAALAMARAQKDTQDQILRARRARHDESQDADGLTPNPDPSQGSEAPPGGHRQDPDFQALVEEVGERAAEILWKRQSGPESAPGEGQAPDDALRADVERIRGRLVGEGHDELRENDAFAGLLDVAAGLQRMDPSLTNEGAMREAVRALEARGEDDRAATQTKRKALANSQPTRPGRSKQKPPATKEERDVAYTRLILQGKTDEAAQLLRE